MLTRVAHEMRRSAQGLFVDRVPHKSLLQGETMGGDYSTQLDHSVIPNTRLLGVSDRRRLCRRFPASFSEEIPTQVGSANAAPLS